MTLVVPTYCRVSKTSRPVYGADVAQREMLHAFEAHAERHKVVRVGVRGAPSLRMQNVGAWHCSDLDVVRPLMAREEFGVGAPVTAVHHSISYEEHLRTTWLPFLLARPRPCDAIVCTSTSARVALLRLLCHVAEHVARSWGIDCSYRGQLEVIPLGVDTLRYHPAEQGGVRRALGISADAFVLLWTGRVSSSTKADLLPLVHVADRLSRANPDRDVQLWVAGSQLPGERGAEMLSDYVRDAGVSCVHVVPERLVRRLPDLAQLYQAADVFVSPVDNVQESFGLTPIEAMACGVPQVVSDWSGYRDTVSDGETGFLIPTTVPGCFGERGSASRVLDHSRLSAEVAVDLDVMERRLQFLLDEPHLRARMGEASRRRAVDVYRWPEVVRQYEDLWDSLRERVDGEHEERAGFARADYRCFRGFASDTLRGDALVVATGREDPWSLPYQREIPTVNVELLDAVLSAAATPVTVSDLGDGSAAVERHMVWLLKHGYLREVSG